MTVPSNSPPEHSLWCTGPHCQLRKLLSPVRRRTGGVNPSPFPLAKETLKHGPHSLPECLRGWSSRTPVSLACSGVVTLYYHPWLAPSQINYLPQILVSGLFLGEVLQPKKALVSNSPLGLQERNPLIQGPLMGCWAERAAVESHSGARTLALPGNPELGEAGVQAQGHEARNIFVFSF